MNILDENFIESQCRLLRSWHIHFRQVGSTWGKKGLKDEEIISHLLKLNNPTFFTRDEGFFNDKLCHPAYCLVHLAVRKDESASFMRRVLKHPDFNTKIKRMGCIIRASHVGLTVYKIKTKNYYHYDWSREVIK